jgi:high-affinity iron transporter
MYDLLSRTVSQALQASLPIAFFLTWLRRADDREALRGLGWGVAASIPATVAAAYWLQASSARAQWEAALAIAALAPAVWFARRVWSGAPPSSTGVTSARRQASLLALVAGTALIIARQAMEIAIVSAAALQSHQADPMLAIAGAVAAAVVITVIWLSVGRRLSAPLLQRATATFAALFVGQLAIYAFHESAEAGVLPWSEVLHVATEPYGPDGIYGRYLSILLFVVPLAVVAAMLLLRRTSPSLPAPRRTRTVAYAIRVAVGVAVVVVAGAILTNVVRSERATSSPAASSSAPSRDMAAIAASPHLLFRHTAVDQNYSRLSAAPLDARGLANAAAGSPRARVMPAGRGITAAADHESLTPRPSFSIGRPREQDDQAGQEPEPHARLGGQPGPTRSPSLSPARCTATRARVFPRPRLWT